MQDKTCSLLSPHAIGFGSATAQLRVYIENIPPLSEYQNLRSVVPLQPGEIKGIGQLTGNHWRKIFNVFAKLLHEYKPNNYSSWQNLREEYLLQKDGNESLLFSTPCYDEIKQNEQLIKKDKIITIIIGKTYAGKLGLTEHCYWLSESFAIDTTTNLIICPYFDYRQLSNIKITQLVQLIKQLEA